MNFDSTAGGCLERGGGRKIRLILLSFLNITVINGVLCKTLDTMRGEMKLRKYLIISAVFSSSF